MAKKDGDLLFFEFSPLPISRSSVGIEASLGLQLAFLVVGDTLLKRLPISIMAKLKSPISADVLFLVAGGNPNGIAPERARSAIMVAETLSTIWDMLKLTLPKNLLGKRCTFLVGIDKTNGRISFRNKVVITPTQMLSRISKEMKKNTRITYTVVMVMWKALLSVIREGRINLPGLRRKVSK